MTISESLFKDLFHPVFENVFEDFILWQMNNITVEDSSTGPAYYIDDNNDLVTIPLETPIYKDGRFWSVPSFSNYLANPLSPVSQTTGTLGTGNYTAWMRGAGSIAVSANTATITGAGSATEGNPLHFSVTVAGTVNVAVTGSCTVFQLTNTVFSTEPFLVNGVLTFVNHAGTTYVPMIVDDKLYSLLSGNKDFKLTFKWIPKFNYSDLAVSTKGNILYSGSQAILQFRTDASGNGYIDLKDGISTTSLSLNWMCGIEYTFEVLVSTETSKMQLVIDYNSSIKTFFDGSFDPDTEMIFGYNTDYLHGITKAFIYNLKQSDFVANPEGYLFSVIESQIVSGTISTTKEITIDWGDGNTNIYNGLNIAYSHTYSSIGLYHVTATGKESITKLIMSRSDCKLVCSIADLPSVMTYLGLSTTQSVITGNVSNLSSVMTYLGLGNTKSIITGNVSDLPSVMTTLNLSNTKSIITGNVSDLPSVMTYLNLYNTQSVLTGNVSNLPSVMTYLGLGNTQSVLTGNVSNLPSVMTYLNLGNTQSIIDSYTRKTWTSNMKYLYLYTVSPGGLDSTEVDNLLIDLAATTWTVDKKIYILGTNAARTSASNAAVASLIGMGVSVTTN